MLETYVAEIEVVDDIGIVEMDTIEVSGFSLEDAEIEAGFQGAVISIVKKEVVCATEGCNCPVEVDEEYCFGCREFSSSVAFGVRTSH
jgi:hypothetical protein